MMLQTTCLALALFLGLPSSANADTLVFNSTNLPNFEMYLGAQGTYWAFKFSADESVTVNVITVAVQDGSAFEDFTANVASAANTGSLGSFTPTSVVDGSSYDTVTFTGSATLEGGNDYWVWIGSRVNTVSINILTFKGAASTQAGLPLSHTLGTADLDSAGFIRDSLDRGYPWIQMLVASPQSNQQSLPNSPSRFTITLQSDEGSECRVPAVTGHAGRWVTLPTAETCTRRDATESSTLLGWATNTDFPIDIAQRQVNNGWGAYETFDDDGQLTGVFIPAGGSTLISNDTNLYPIWSE